MFFNFSGHQVGLFDFLKVKAAVITEQLRARIKQENRGEVISPKPLRGLITLVSNGDKKVFYKQRFSPKEVITGNVTV